MNFAISNTHLTAISNRHSLAFSVFTGSVIALHPSIVLSFEL